MPIGPGTRLGPYEITAQIGAGGMGEVYRARDTRLDRTVAIKVLPAAVASDPGLRERFDREARAVAALNHPHICALYDIGDEAGTSFLVMEHLEGETLADRLVKGALPIDQALVIAIQIADALDKAHRAGIVHRDLKPGNIMLVRRGRASALPDAKLLDFGLAKITPAVVAASGLSVAPTVETPVTLQGTILGTLQYMAPEQLEGQDADARTDIFAFGAVLYEMLTGKKAFAGKSQASLISAIMSSDPPPIATFQPPTPAALDHVVKRCLAKDHDDRWQSAGDLTRELKWVAESPSLEGAPASIGTRPPPKRLVGLVGAAIVMAVVVAAVTWYATRSGPAPVRSVTRFAITLAPNGLGLVNLNRVLVAISPDGTRLVYAANNQLYLRALDQLDAVPIRGTDGAGLPFFSPDGQWIGFGQNGQLKKMPVAGGAPVVLCAAANFIDASWDADGSIVFSQGRNGISRVPAAGGVPEVVVKVDAGQAAFHPRILPGGQVVLFTLSSGPGADRVVAQSLGSGQRQVVVQGGSDARYLPTGHLIYVADGTLLGVPFDLATLKVTGGPVPLVEGVATGTSRGVGEAAQFSVSRTGSLAYVPAATLQRWTLVWVDRQGREEALPAEPRAYRYPRISPDGTRVAIATQDQSEDVWIWTFARATLTRLTFARARAGYPIWSRDGQSVVFGSQDATGPPNLYRQAADGTGTAERLTKSPNSQFPVAFTPDGKTLVFREIVTGQYDISILSMDGDRTTKPLINSSFNEDNADLSFDGRWIAYQSDESGRDEVYVRPFPRVDDGRWQVSVGGGTRPVWAQSGRELFYLAPDGGLMSVSVQTQSNFSASSPTKLFEGAYVSSSIGRHFDVAPDGQRFLMIKDNAASREPLRLIVVENWLDELKRLVPTK